LYTESPSPVKERLLEAATICLQRRGYAATTARDVATEAGANLRSIGYHYGSTRELLLRAISVNWRRWLAPLIAAASDPAQPPAEQLRIGLALFVDALPSNAPMVRAWLEAVLLARDDEDLRGRLARNQLEFRVGLARTLAAAGHADAEAGATAIINVCDGLVVRYLLHGEAVAPAEVARAAAAALDGTA
jgi:AcrR family transcriptional regulator